MKVYKSSAVIPHQTLAELCRHITHNLNFRVDQDGHGSIVEGPAVGLLAELDRFVWLCVAVPSLPFRIGNAVQRKDLLKQDAYGRRYATPRRIPSKVAVSNPFARDAREMVAFLDAISTVATILDPSYRAANRLLYPPHISLLLDVFFGHPIRHSLVRGINSSVDDSGRLKAEVYNDFVDKFRQAILARKLLQRERHNWYLGSQENVGHLHTCVNDLFTKHGSLTALHLRLFHARERASLISAPVEEQHRDLCALRSCRTVFFDRLRRKPALFTAEPRCIWSIQPSLEGGYDLHVTLLFDTVALRKVLEDNRVETGQTGAISVDHADLVGAYWVDVATGGRGDYIRADRFGRLYGGDWVHGEVRADDLERREKLRKTLSLLALRRALVRLKDEPPGVYFGMPERKARAPRRPARGSSRIE